MKKRIFGRKFSRGSGSRRALYRSLIKALVDNGKIITTKTKAKAVQKHVERVVNLSKKDSVSKKRQVYKILGNDRSTTEILFSKISKEFADRVGGYTRITPLPRRRGDSAEMARLEWVKDVSLEDKKEEKKRGKKEGRKEKKKDQKKGEKKNK